MKRIACRTQTLPTIWLEIDDYSPSNLSYDAENRLYRVHNSGVADLSFADDGDGRRVMKAWMPAGGRHNRDILRGIAPSWALGNPGVLTDERG
jgi:hypothetical protein